MKTQALAEYDAARERSATEVDPSVFEVDVDGFINSSVWRPEMALNILHDYVAISPFAPPSMTATGIVVPNTNAEPTVGLVVGVGPDTESLLPGDIVKYNGKNRLCDLTGDLGVEYRDYPVIVTKSVNVFAILQRTSEG